MPPLHHCRGPDLTPRRCAIGDWKYVNGGWEYDSGAPDADPTVTSMLPIYAGSAPEPVITPAAPPDTADAGLGGQLSTVTDEEWRAAHERLIAEHPELADELRYTWDPDLDGSSLIDPDERDIAHPEGHYNPDADERFRGGPSSG